MANPAYQTAHFILIYPQIFGIRELLLNPPSASPRPGYPLQRSACRAEDQVIGLVWWVRWDATNEQPMLPVVFPAMQDGQARPLEKQRSFCARLHTEAPPILLVDEPLLSLRYRHQGAS